jgi:hypothetical protein
MKVAVYHKSIPNAKNQEKVDLLKYFSQGVVAAGDQAIDVQDHTYCSADVGVIQGWLAKQVNSSVHQQLRQTVINTQLSKNRYVVTADSNLFLYSVPGNPLHYLRYSFNGVFPKTGNYCDSDPDPARWKKISHAHNIALKPYRTTGNHILLCLQRNGGWSMGSYDILEWAANVILELRTHTDRPIVIRPHPGDKSARAHIGDFNADGLLKDVALSQPGASLIDDLKNCWAVVNHNSSPVVGAAIEGYPIFVTDYTKSQCREIANTDLSTIETPTLFDRQAWVERISMFHWNFEELKSGECWQHMRQFVQQ